MFLLKSRKYFAIAVLILVGVGAGCSFVLPPRINLLYPDGNKDSGWTDSNLKSRFEAYWHYRFSGDIEKEFALESPDFREVVPFGRYKNYVQHAVQNKLIKMEILKISKESQYVVRVDCVADIQVAGSQIPSKVSLADRWVLVKGQWYHVLHDLLIYSL